MTQTVGLGIIWRNPKPPHRQQRWQRINRVSGAARYMVQELVLSSAGPFWTLTSSLELLSGGRVA